MTTYRLKLYLSGRTPETDRTIDKLRAIMVEYHDDYELEIIDVLSDPQRAEDDRILATPTLVRELPQPIRRLIGDLSDAQGVLLGLELEPAAAGGGAGDAASHGDAGER